MPRILFVLEGYFPSHQAGTEQYVHSLAKSLQNNKWDVCVLISTTKHTEDYSYDGIEVKTFKVPEIASLRELNGLVPPSGIEEFKGIVRAYQPDIVHFHSFGRAINSFHLVKVKELGIQTCFTTHLAGFFCIRGDFQIQGQGLCDGFVSEKRCLKCVMRSKGITRGISNVASFLTCHIPGKLRRFLPPQLHIVKHRLNEIERVKKHADAIIAISPWIEDLFDRNGILDQVSVVRQGVPGTPAPVEYSLSTREEGIKLGFIGRMHPVKGFDVLRAALAQLKDVKYTLSVFTLSPSDKSDYYNDRRKWGKDHSQVKWIENSSHSEVLAGIKNIDLLIVPSLSEMAPLVVMEAFALKIPVLGSSIAAITDTVVDNVNGRVFRTNDSTDLAAKIQEVVHNPQLLINWSQNIGSVRTFADVSEEMNGIYRSILKGT